MKYDFTNFYGILIPMIILSLKMIIAYILLFIIIPFCLDIKEEKNIMLTISHMIFSMFLIKKFIDDVLGMFNLNIKEFLESKYSFLIKYYIFAGIDKNIPNFNKKNNIIIENYYSEILKISYVYNKDMYHTEIPLNHLMDHSINYLFFKDLKAIKKAIKNDVINRNPASYILKSMKL